MSKNEEIVIKISDKIHEEKVPVQIRIHTVFLKH